MIIFTDGTHLTCDDYSYSYSSMPTAVIFAKALTYQGKTTYLDKMLVEDDLYDMRK